MKYRFIGRFVCMTIAGALAAAGLTGSWPSRASAAEAVVSSPAPPQPGVSGSTWDSCAQLKWKIRRPGISRQTIAQVRRAVAELNSATGLNFVYAGHASRAEMDSPADGTMVIGFSSGLAKKNYGGITRLKKVAIDDTNVSRIVNARLVINKALLSGERSQLFMPVLLHELGHAVGLTHVGDASDIMYPIAVKGATYRGAVLTKLASVGSLGVCGGG